MAGLKEFQSVESILKRNLEGEDYEKIRQVLYGRQVM